MSAPIGLFNKGSNEKRTSYIDFKDNTDFTYSTIPLINPKFSVLHFSTYYKGAGQSIAANRLCKGLYENNIQSDIIVSPRRIVGNPPNNVHIAKYSTGPYGVEEERKTLYKYPTRHVGVGDNFHTGLIGIDIEKEIEEYNPDIVQLHFINDGFVALESLPKIKKPIVWRLSDCWAFTGGCHFCNNCIKYKTKCDKCYILNSVEDTDISKDVWERKYNIYNECKDNLHIVTPAKWLYDKCKESPLMKDMKIYHIPNGLNTTTDYFPENRDGLKELFNLPNNKKIILFGAEDAGGVRKGINYLKQALSLIEDKDKYHFVTFGHLVNGFEKVNGITSSNLGPIYNTSILRKLYSIADVFVCPSLVEPFGQVVTESMACGTPVVCFSNTGPSSIIKHKITGYIAEYKNVVDLKQGIDYVINNNMRTYAREDAINTYDINVTTKQYLDLYNNILNN